MNADKLEIVDMDTHRNGIGGMPFTVALVDELAYPYSLLIKNIY